jgi:hypothetical protein
MASKKIQPDPRLPDRPDVHDRRLRQQSSSSNPTTPPVDTAPPALPNGLSVDYAPRQQT